MKGWGLHRHSPGIVAATRLVTAVLVLCLVVLSLDVLGLGVLGLGGDSPARAADAGPHYYLALGGSDSVGFQPTAASPRGAPTDEGYADDLLAAERARWGDLHLVQLGCPGETTMAMLYGGDRCHGTTSQLSLAVSFLEQHPSTVLVTLDVGFNDIIYCLAHHLVDEPCVEIALATIRSQLPQILATLRRVGSPTLQIVGVDHYDPYLTAYLGRPAAKAFANLSVDVISRLNDTLRAAYGAADVPMADVAGAFAMESRTPSVLPDGAAVPLDVARTCALTWACVTGPMGHNKHPNADGYRLISQAIAPLVTNP